MAEEKKIEQAEVAEGEEPEGSENDNESGAEGEGEGKPKRNLKKLILFIAGPLLLIGIIVGALYFFGVIGGASPEVKPEDKKPEAIPIAEQLHDVFSYNLPSMLINLRTTGRRTSFLKVTISLEVKGNEEVKKEMEQLKPRIIDQFQTYLRELEVDDLQGSAGLQRLKEELLDRVNAVTAPIKVQNVLFSEFLVQ